MTPPLDCEALLDQLNSALATLDTAIETVLKEAEQIAFEQVATLVEDDASVLLETARLVWTDDINAGKSMAQLKQAFGTRFPAQVDQIARSVDGFDFEAAKEPIRTIAAELNIRLDGADYE
jgi:uncharacterized protein (DUF1697 family)